MGRTVLLEAMIAWRYLSARGGRLAAVLSAAGIALGVSTLIIVMAVMNGFRCSLLDRVLGLSAHVSIERTGDTISDYDAVGHWVAGLTGVVSVAPVVEGGSLIFQRGGGAQATLVTGVRRRDVPLRVADGLVAGSMNDFVGAHSALLGVRLANRLGVSVGSQVTLLVPQVIDGEPRFPISRLVTVVGVFHAQLREYDDGRVFVPLPTAQALFGWQDTVRRLDVRIEDPQHLQPTLAALSGHGYQLSDWRRKHASLLNAIQVERVSMFLVLALVIVVAVLNVTSALATLTRDKAQEISILRTMGATPGTVARTFFILGATLGVLGSAIGIGVGVGVASCPQAVNTAVQTLRSLGFDAGATRFLASVPMRADPIAVIAVAITALALSLMGAAYPSWRAAGIDPANALRNE